MTFYASTDDLPDFKDYSMDNRTYRYFKGTPLYPFGYGLSYGKITYADASVSKTAAVIGDTVTVQTVVKNESDYPLYEAVQVYVHDVESETRTPIWQLRGVQCVCLLPGESQSVSLTLKARDFAIIREDGSCVVEPGAFKVAIGGQQPDARSAQLTGRKVDIFDIVLEGETTTVEY